MSSHLPHLMEGDISPKHTAQNTELSQLRE
jgi:hypothetical protein